MTNCVFVNDLKRKSIPSGQIMLVFLFTMLLAELLPDSYLENIKDKFELFSDNSKYYKQLQKELHEEAKAAGIKQDNGFAYYYDVHNMPASESKEKLLKITNELKMEQFFTYQVYGLELANYRASLIYALEHEEQYKGKLYGIHVIDMLELAKGSKNEQIKALLAEINIKYKTILETEVQRAKLRQLFFRFQTEFESRITKLTPEQQKIFNEISEYRKILHELPSMEKEFQKIRNFGDEKILNKLTQVEHELNGYIQLHTGTFGDVFGEASKVIVPIKSAKSVPAIGTPVDTKWHQ